MKLYFFGDSYTFGHGLPDCCIYSDELKAHIPGDSPSKHVWPNLVSKNLNLAHTNLSWPGMSNLRIHWKIRHTKIKTDDIAVVQWSFPYRCVILDDESNFRDIMSYQNTKESKHFFKIHTNMDLERRSLLIIEHTELLLKSLGIKHIFLANYNFDNSTVTTQSEILDYEHNYLIDKAVDGAHPGIETNKRWSERVTTLMKQKFNI